MPSFAVTGASTGNGGRGCLNCTHSKELPGRLMGTFLRIAIFVAIGAMIFFGLRRIWRDFTGAARAEDERRRQRDLAERKRPDVIDLRRSDDGIFRPGQDGKDSDNDR